MNTVWSDMEVHTSRFGLVECAGDDVIRFAEGLPGLAECHDWVILTDAQQDAVAWLQSLRRPEVALALVSPRRFVAGYQLRVARRELEPLRLDSLQTAQVLAIVSRSERGLTLNLKAPLVVNPLRRLGRQVIANRDAPLQYELTHDPGILRKTA